MIENQEECVALLEQLRWSGQPICPYCNSIKASRIKREQRYHCNGCFTSYSVTVGTIFHRTHVKLPQWFQAIEIVMQRSPNVSVRKLANEIGVNKNTAANMLGRIHRATETGNEPFLKLIIHATLEMKAGIAYSTTDMILKD